MNLVVRSTRVPIAELPRPEDEVSFPVPGHRSVLGLGWAFADHHFRGDELLAPPAGSG